MISGGLDSALALCMMQDQGIQVFGLHYILPWEEKRKRNAQAVAQELRIPLRTIWLKEKFFEMVKNARYGYGTGINPCIDCRIFTFRLAQKYMKSLGAHFVFTGEVLGQRPMSQLKDSLKIVEERSGLKGILLRPLCARFLEPTIAEKEGWINREKLLDISGRSRKKQYALLKKYRIKHTTQPAGGCILTDKNFACRVRDLLKYGYRDFCDVKVLSLGRHFRLTKKHKAIAGRNQRENNKMLKYTHAEDMIVEFEKHSGPTVVLQGKNPSRAMIKKAGGIVQYFSRFKNESPLEVIYFQKGQKREKKKIVAAEMFDEFIGRHKIQHAK